jgi:two-component system sensor histidine kinase PilS (NtrC family)
MFSLDEKIFSANPKQVQRIQTLIVGRLLVIFLLLVTSWFWHSGQLKLSFEEFPKGLFLVFLISVGLTIVYFFLARLSKNFTWQVRVQFILDALLTTWLVWQTGDLSSPYITLYIVLIGVSSIFLRPHETILLAVFCVLLFTGLSILSAAAVISSTSPVQSPLKVIQIIGFHLIAFLFVGLLASRLSERHSSGETLKETAKTLADLRALHERIVESIRSGLITTDLEGNIFTFNSAATEITGYKAEEMNGQSIFSLFGNIQEPMALSLQVAETGEQQPRFEADLATPDGFAVRIGYSISPLFTETSESRGLIITFQDLTEIRSMEESVRRKDRLAAVGRVAAGLAHEIRNPLGAMRGAIQVLESNTPPESMQADLMDIILRESDRLNKIITNFLSYARPGVTNFSETDVCDSIRDTFTLLRHSPDVKETHIVEANLPEEPVIISADPTQLKQIFWNLARNAIQAMPDGGKFRVTLELVPINRVRITFEDTGIGMSPEQVEQLFEPFSNSASGGTGLGLSIVYQIVRDHGGSINVRSHEGEGTVITVELPREFKVPPTRNDISIDETQPADKAPLKDFLKLRSEENKLSS